MFGFNINMQVGKVNIYSTNTTNKYNKVPTFTRKLQPQEEADYNKNAIGAALDYLGTQSLAMILHGSCNPVTENDLGIGSPCNEKAKDVIALERLHGFNANQLGPMGEITRGDISPYSASVFALNRMFIDAEALTQDRYANIIPEEELKTLRVKYSDTPGGYTYSKFFDSFENYDRVIKDAYTNFRTKVRAKDPNALALLDEYNEFKSKKRNRAIMSAIFEVLSNTYGTRDVSAWESEIDRNLPVLLKNKDKEAIERYRQITKRSADDINSYIFGQFLINKQLKENKIYRDSIGFEYINDNLVGNDKSEVWMYPEVFLEKYRLGCPEGGKDNGPQLWDIPVVDPQKLFDSKGDLGPAGKFLKDKLEAALEYCENIRIDHALGLVDPYLYDKNTVFETDGHLDRQRFYGANISQMGHVDPNGEYKEILVKIVLPTLAEHGITPIKAVWEDLGNQTSTFNDIYRNKLHIPGMTQLHWDRSEVKPKENWAMMGSHDEPSAISLVKNTWMQNQWDYGDHAWHVDYLSGYLNQDDARAAEREAFKQKLLSNPNERVKAKFAELFVASDRVQIPFTDFFGIEARYNEKGTKSAANWKLRLNDNFEDAYYKNLQSNNPTAINMPEILKMAVQAKVDHEVTQYKRTHTGPDNSIDEENFNKFRSDLYKQVTPILEKLNHYEHVLKEQD